MYCIAKVDQVRKGPSRIFREAKGKVRMRLTRGIFLEMAILKDECANPRIDYNPPEKLCQLVFGGSGLAGTHLVSIVHGQGDTGSLEIVHVHDDLVSAISRGVGQFQLSRPRGDKVGGFVLSRQKNKRFACQRNQPPV